MPSVDIDGISTHYQILGDGPPLLMFSPGGFDARLDQWRDLGVYARIKLLDHLPGHYQCILFDRRENGQSGGRLERISWANYVAQGAGLLDHLDIEKAHLLGGCMGCAPVAAFAVAHPDRVFSMVHYWPVGGPHYRISSHQRFTEHLTYVGENGLQAVVNLVLGGDKNFSKDPRGGPWCSVIRNDPEFAKNYAAADDDAYVEMVGGMYRTLFDRDTAPGAEPEDLMGLDIPSLIIPGADKFHATSAACYLHECLASSEYWDMPVDQQTEDNAPDQILEFLRR